MRLWRRPAASPVRSRRTSAVEVSSGTSRSGGPKRTSAGACGRARSSSLAALMEDVAPAAACRVQLPGGRRGLDFVEDVQRLRRAESVQHIDRFPARHIHREPSMPDHATRLEHDLLGPKEVPGRRLLRRADRARRSRTSTSRASQLRLYPDLIKALAMVKLAAARANFDCGAVRRRDPRRASKARARRSSTASCTTSSGSTCSRAAPARRPT